jgi:hypothetical protein
MCRLTWTWKVVFAAAILYRVNYSAIIYGTSCLTATVDGQAISSGDLVPGYSQVVFTAHPPQGYTVKQWKWGSEVVLGSDGAPLQDLQYILPQLASSVTVTVEFESPLYKTLVSLESLVPVSGVINGAEKSVRGLGLPAKVTLHTDSGDVLADVTWDVAGCAYDQMNADAQTFTVEGAVALPAGVVNPDGVSLTASVEVSVNAAISGSAILTDIIPSLDVSGVINGAEKSVRGLACRPK